MDYALRATEGCVVRACENVAELFAERSVSDTWKALYSFCPLCVETVGGVTVFAAGIMRMATM